MHRSSSIHAGLRRLTVCAQLLVPCTLLAVFSPGHAFAQEFRGTISGAVTDPTGAVIPGAAVTIREVHTGTVNNTKSDSAGQYVVPFLLPGDYSVSVSLAGFQTTTRAGITLQSQEHPIINLALSVGETTQVVNVTSAAPLVDQANASVGQVISTESVADLPLNGRTPTTLTELSEGVITTAAPQIVHPFDNNAGNSWSIGGTPNQVSEVLLDGSPDLTLLGALAYAPTQDSVQEVSIRPFDTDASFGHTIGGVINQITKSGTNSFHGTAYEFYQTAGLDANLYFNKRANPVASRPNAHFHQYGGTFGGPVRIPKLFNGTDKLFFFFAYEGLHDSTPATTSLTVPTQAERNGDFSQTLIAGCPNGFANNPATAAAICLPYGTNTGNTADPNQLYNPNSGTVNSSGKTVRTAILDNQLASVGGVNPVAQAYFGLIPLPNTTSGVAATGLGNYISPAPSVDRYSNEFGRIDYALGARDRIFADIRHNVRTQVKNDFFGNGLTGTTLLRENFGSSLDNVFTLNSSTIIDTRLNWTYFDETHGTPAQRYSPATVGLPTYLAAGTAESQLPCINFTTSSTVGTCGTTTNTYATLGDNTSALDPTTSYQLFTDAVKIIGRHTLKIGFDGRQYRLSVENFGNSVGSFGFGPSFVNAGSGNITSGPLSPSSSVSLRRRLRQLLLRPANSRTIRHSGPRGLPRVLHRLLCRRRLARLRSPDASIFGLRFDIDTPFRDKLTAAPSDGFNPAATQLRLGTAAALRPSSRRPSPINGVTTSFHRRHQYPRRPDLPQHQQWLPVQHQQRLRELATRGLLLQP